MAHYWFPVSHGEPERAAALVSSPPWGDDTTAAVFVCASLWTLVSGKCLTAGKEIDVLSRISVVRLRESTYSEGLCVFLCEREKFGLKG